MKNNKERRLFCEINPFFYYLSSKKENLKRRIKNVFSNERIAKRQSTEKLPYLGYEMKTNMIKRAPGVVLEHQLNKAVNIDIASKTINGLIIAPQESFSFWSRVGNTTKRKGYKIGRVIKNKKLVIGYGGGLCNLANVIHLLVIHSPLDVTELHTHSDALSPDEGKRVPLSAGTSVNYINLDFRFKNNTDGNIQLLTWCDGDFLCAELRSDVPFENTYEITEEDHRFVLENGKYYRRSKIYKLTRSKESGDVLEKKLILNNRSEVLYSYDLIPKEQIVSV